MEGRNRVSVRRGSAGSVDWQFRRGRSDTVGHGRVSAVDFPTRKKAVMAIGKFDLFWFCNRLNT